MNNISIVNHAIRDRDNGFPTYCDYIKNTFNGEILLDEIYLAISWNTQRLKHKCRNGHIVKMSPFMVGWKDSNKLKWCATCRDQYLPWNDQYLNIEPIENSTLDQNSII